MQRNSIIQLPMVPSTCKVDQNEKSPKGPSTNFQAEGYLGKGAQSTIYSTEITGQQCAIKAYDEEFLEKSNSKIRLGF